MEAQLLPKSSTLSFWASDARAKNTHRLNVIALIDWLVLFELQTKYQEVYSTASSSSILYYSVKLASFSPEFYSASSEFSSVKDAPSPTYSSRS